MLPKWASLAMRYTGKFMLYVLPYSKKLGRQKTLSIDNQFAKVSSVNLLFILISFVEILNPPMFSLPNMFWVPIRQSFLPPKFFTV